MNTNQSANPVKSCGCGPAGSCGTTPKGAQLPIAETVVTPRVDIMESADSFTVRADMPGVRPDGIKIELDKGVLTLSGSRTLIQREAASTIVAENHDRNYRRTFRIGQGVDAENIKAELKDGVLTLRLPKAQALRARVIPVQSN